MCKVENIRFNNNKRGTVILVAKDPNCDTAEIFREQNDNIIKALISYQCKKILLGSMYGPNNTRSSIASKGRY